MSIIKGDIMSNQINTELIKNYLKENKLSPSAFCKMCKIDYMCYKKIMDGKNNFRIGAIFKISRQLNLYLHQMFIP